MDETFYDDYKEFTIGYHLITISPIVYNRMSVHCNQEPFIVLLWVYAYVWDTQKQVIRFDFF